MKKILLIIAFLTCGSSVFAEGFITLGYDSEVLGRNSMLDSSSGSSSYFDGDIGYLWDTGFSLAFKYDHMGMDDYNFGGKNALVVAVISSAGPGYSVKFMDGKLIWQTTALLGYAVEVRYRLNVTDYRTDGIAPSLTTALYYQFDDRFGAGIDAGYRYLIAKYGDPINASLDLRGIFMGLELKYMIK